MTTAFRFLTIAAALSLGGTFIGCGSEPSNPTTETSCTDGVDNDVDGLTDCDDDDCADDLVACPDPCGDGTCDVASGETPTTCPADCVNPCGDGTCDATAGETETTCPADCLTGPCGDGTCDAAGGETPLTCAVDCDGSSCANAIPMEPLQNSLGGTFYEGNGVLNPGGNRDYYQFTVEAAGDWWRVMTEANADDISGNVDTVVTLYNADGSTVLAEKDDASPRMSVDTEFYHRFLAGGTYCLMVWEWSDWAGETPLGDPAFNYRLAAVPIDFTLYVEYTEEEEPNDNSGTATTVSFDSDQGYYYTQLVGEFGAAAESDWYEVTTPASVVAMGVDFTAGEGIDDAYGGTVDTASVTVYDGNGTTILATLNSDSGADGISSLILAANSTYYIEVTAPSGSMGANPFYVVKGSLSGTFNPLETNDASNDDWANAEAMAGNPPADGTVSYFIGGTLDVSGGGDIDWWSVGATAGDEIAVACSSWRVGSGIRDATFALFTVDASTVPMQSETEVETADVYWGAGFGASEAEINVTTSGTHYFKVSATNQSATVTSSHYLCGIHVTTP